MKIAYLAHPIGGDVDGNIKKLLQIIKEINLNEPDVVPFAPYIPDCLALDDNIPEERMRGIKNDVELFKKTQIDEVRLYGNKISMGMLEEVKLAKKLGINVRPMTDETFEGLKELFPGIYREFVNGDVLVCGDNEELYDFGYYVSDTRVVVYIKGERNAQDSYSYNIDRVRKATDVDIAKQNWGW